MKLSKYFSLEEFTRSDTARRLGIDNTPTPEHIQNLSDMCVNLLDPLRHAGDVGFAPGPGRAHTLPIRLGDGVCALDPGRCEC